MCSHLWCRKGFRSGHQRTHGFVSAITGVWLTLAKSFTISELQFLHLQNEAFVLCGLQEASTLKLHCKENACFYRPEVLGWLSSQMKEVWVGDPLSAGVEECCILQLELRSPNEFLITRPTWGIWAKPLYCPSPAPGHNAERWAMASVQVLSLERKKPLSIDSCRSRPDISRFLHNGQKD